MLFAFVLDKHAQFDFGRIPCVDISSELMYDIPFELINGNSESMQGNANY